MLDINIEDYIPHRDRMKLIEEVLEVADGRSVTVSTVSEQWPMFRDGYVNPIIMIELVAQTSSLAVGWKKRNEEKVGGKGWLVGLKEASFDIESLPLNTRLVTEIDERYSHDNYVVLDGSVFLEEKHEDKKIAKIAIQAFRPD
ncbi:MAG: hypothetical protein GY754_30395 [bacterium]|nr:hypothetical protein [bacterium]